MCDLCGRVWCACLRAVCSFRVCCVSYMRAYMCLRLAAWFCEKEVLWYGKKEICVCTSVELCVGEVSVMMCVLCEVWRVPDASWRKVCFGVSCAYMVIMRDVVRVDLSWIYSFTNVLRLQSNNMWGVHFQYWKNARPNSPKLGDQRDQAFGVLRLSDWRIHSIGWPPPFQPISKDQQRVTSSWPNRAREMLEAFIGSREISPFSGLPPFDPRARVPPDPLVPIRQRTLPWIFVFALIIEASELIITLRIASMRTYEM